MAHKSTGASNGSRGAYGLVYRDDLDDDQHQYGQCEDDNCMRSPDTSDMVTPCASNNSSTPLDESHDGPGIDVEAAAAARQRMAAAGDAARERQRIRREKRWDTLQAEREQRRRWSSHASRGENNRACWRSRCCRRCICAVGHDEFGDELGANSMLSATSTSWLSPGMMCSVCQRRDHVAHAAVAAADGELEKSSTRCLPRHSQSVPKTQ